MVKNHDNFVTRYEGVRIKSNLVCHSTLHTRFLCESEDRMSICRVSDFLRFFKVWLLFPPAWKILGRFWRPFPHQILYSQGNPRRKDDLEEKNL